jgi:hypothetical protein
VDWARRNGYRVVTSVDMQTWELVTAACVVKNVPIDLIIPPWLEENGPGAKEYLREQFSLDVDRTEFVTVADVAAASDRQLWMRERDKLAVELADIIAPISVSPRGTMQARLTAVQERKRIVRDFEVAELDNGEPHKSDFDSAAINLAVDGVSSGYVFHWTRTNNGPWPGERALDYYREIMLSSVYPRSALATLKRIVSTRRIIASSRHMPANLPTVSFSALPPRKVVPLMKWRSRYGEMTFEPYAVGIRNAVALEHGVAPVLYYNAGVWKRNTAS